MGSSGASRTGGTSVWEVGKRSPVAGRRSPVEVAGRRSEVAGRRSEVAGRRSEVAGKTPFPVTRSCFRTLVR